MRRGAKVLTQDAEEVRLQQEAVVDGDEADVRQLVPAGRAAPRQARVHDVVGHEGVRVAQLLRAQHLKQLLPAGTKSTLEF